jgi:hypothetical protein
MNHDANKQSHNASAGAAHPANDLIDRYVYQVIKRLPQTQRTDIEAELRGLIDDMLSARGSAGRDDVIAVLRELGRPAELAAKYSGSKRHLIGPEYFDIYLLVLKIVLAASTLGMVLVQVIGYVATPPESVWQAIGQFFAAVFTGLIQAFAWVTGVFALIERLAKGSPCKDQDWNPAELPPLPEQKAAIKRSEPIVGIVFTVLFLVILNVSPQLFSAYIHVDGVLHTAPVFDLAVFYRQLPLIDVMICLGLVKELLRLIVGRYTLPLSLALTVLNVAAMIMFIFLFGPASGIWNPDFMAQIGTEWSLSAGAAHLWSLVPKILVGLCIFGNVVDSIQLIVRGFRHREA